jgi:uncharacterized protein
MQAGADTVLTTLRAHQGELRGRGLCHVSLFGSVARDEDGPESDIDLVAEVDPAACLGLFGLAALERRLGDLLGRKVDLIVAPVEQPRLRSSIERDARRAF